MFQKLELDSIKDLVADVNNENLIELRKDQFAE